MSHVQGESLSHTRSRTRLSGPGSEGQWRHTAPAPMPSHPPPPCRPPIHNLRHQPCTPYGGARRRPQRRISCIALPSALRARKVMGWRCDECSLLVGTGMAASAMKPSDHIKAARTLLYGYCTDIRYDLIVPLTGSGRPPTVHTEHRSAFFQSEPYSILAQEY